MKTLERQVGGDHYKNLPVQPMYANVANNTPWAEGEIIKYVTRWRAKGGVQDLEKARHILEYLIEFHTEEKTEGSAGEVLTAAGEEGCELCSASAEWCSGGVYVCNHHEAMRRENPTGFIVALMEAKDAAT